MNPSDLTSRHVAANGARFHVVEQGRGELVLLLHGFPHDWWSWRHQLQPLADAGFRAVAMDLRGYGDSDKPPRGYDPMTLATDVAGVVRSLGARDAAIAGQGWGGYVGWTVAAAHPAIVRSLCAVSAPHPAEMLGSRLAALRPQPLVHVLAMQVPWLPERRIMRGGYLTKHLESWSSPTSSYPSTTEIEYYRAALRKWPAPHCALEYHRWLFRSRLRADGRTFTRLMRPPISRPVLTVSGADDPVVTAELSARSGRRVGADYRHVTVAGAGHFVPEEQPAAMTRVLLEWLARADR